MRKRKKEEMTSLKLKKLKESKPKEDNRAIIVIVIIMVIAALFLIYFFFHEYNKFMGRIKGSNPDNSDSLFPNLNFGQEPFTTLVAACEGKAMNDQCNFTRNSTVISGDCKPSHENKLVCMPTPKQ